MPLSLGLRIFLVYGAFVGLIGYFVLKTVNDEIKPAVRQSTEETLVDTANLLAELLSADARLGNLPSTELNAVLKRYQARRPDAEIWGLTKRRVSHRIYITDARGIVLFDSADLAVGQDYSQWNDVYLTLRGQYGARSTADDPDDESSTVMYVAAPIRDKDQIIGVITVAKPNRTLEPYIVRSQRRLLVIGGSLIALGLLFGGALSWRFGGALRKLSSYASAVSRGERATVPELNGSDLRQLADAIEAMRIELDGKAYVEQYVQTLTHELKTPLAAINAAAELLHGELSEADRHRFLANIEVESARLHHLSERLLNLAQVEQRTAVENVERFSLTDLVGELVDQHEARVRQQGITLSIQDGDQVSLRGERFLLQQAIDNLLDNAIDFTDPGGQVHIAISSGAAEVVVRITNTGTPIPAFALARLTERFYSLPRPATGRKSTGLGLSFVHEVAALHGGRLAIENVTDGVAVTLTLPQQPSAVAPR